MHKYFACGPYEWCQPAKLCEAVWFLLFCFLVQSSTQLHLFYYLYKHEEVQIKYNSCCLGLHLGLVCITTKRCTGMYYLPSTSLISSADRRSFRHWESMILLMTFSFNAGLNMAAVPNTHWEWLCWHMGQTGTHDSLTRTHLHLYLLPFGSYQQQYLQ